MRRSGATVVLLIACLTAVPWAQAAHWSLDPVTGGASATGEDDAKVWLESGHPLDGRANRVTEPGRSPGDGGLFLDAVFGSSIPFADAPHVHATTLAMAAETPPNLLLPGFQSVAVWYGWWYDADADRRILDAHDACELCIDEFQWRGIASGEFVGMRAYWSLARNDSNDQWWRDVRDMTDLDRSEQVWLLQGTFLPETPGPHALGTTGVPGGSLVQPLQTLVLAGAPPTLGSPLGYDIDDADAMYDVDRFETINEDVAALYRAAVHGPDETSRAAVAAIMGAADSICAAADPVCQSALQGAIDAIVLASALVGEAGPTFQRLREEGPRTYAHLGKEPTLAQDDFEDRALFGGVGDFYGSGNSYDGYASDHHLFVDNIVFERYCARADVPSPQAGGTLATTGTWCVANSLFEDATWANVGSGWRTSGTLLGFRAFHALWRDRNHDSHIGRLCDPDDPEAFDPERNTCRNTLRPWPHVDPVSTDRLGGEIAKICSLSEMRGGTIRLDPIAGAWPGALVVRHYATTTRAADWTLEERHDGAPIFLRVDTACDAGGWWLYSRDALLFPTGPSRVAIRVEAHAAIAGFKDAATGIDVGRERVIDVDLIHPAL